MSDSKGNFEHCQTDLLNDPFMFAAKKSGRRPPTIDDDFDQYFAQLML
jgi:hypothetical protein